ncbi:hypothetical protein JCM33374_g2040 [Metschnikowia sp. JCM 33374]|nr:hypothetical protein JCM33374_g2040 [Metschnikowia sp. JCM 33374]
MAPPKRKTPTGKKSTGPRKLAKDEDTQGIYTKWTNKDRIILRRRRKETGDTLQAIADWFFKTHKKFIRVSTVGDFLSRKHAWLDDVDPENPPEKKYNPQWPVLDKILITWHLNEELGGNDVSTDAIVSAAKSIWALLPPEARFNVQYKKVSEPHWSQGFVSRFKERYAIASRGNQGGEFSAPTAALQVAQTIDEVRVIVDLYAPENVYSMNESGLYWNRGPSTLSLDQLPGYNPDLARICFTLCCNADGSHKLPIHFVGKTKNPGTFEETENTEPTEHPAEWVWDGNRCGWMTSELVVKWFRMFYKHVADRNEANRNVLLLMTDCFAHRCAFVLNPPPANIRVLFLPVGLFRSLQPLSQGIVQHVKHYYLERTLKCRLDSCSFFSNLQSVGGTLPPRAFNLSTTDAIAWLNEAWTTGIKPETISNCWVKSSLIQKEGHDVANVVEEKPKDISRLYYKVVRVSDADDPKFFPSFLNPAGEDMPPIREPPTLEDLVYCHLPVSPEDEQNEMNVSVTWGPERLTQVARHAADLRFYVESINQCTPEMKELFGQLSRIIKRHYQASLKQPTLETMGVLGTSGVDVGSQTDDGADSNSIDPQIHEDSLPDFVEGQVHVPVE